MKKKILILTLCIALLAVAAVGGTLAYFTDTEEVTNTFTVGNVKIELLESQLLRAEGITDEAIAADAEGYAAYLAQAGKNILPGISVKKAPYIRNTGSNNAYVRLRMLIPVELVDIVTCVYTSEAVTDGSVTDPVKLANVTIDGVEYAQFAVVYNEKLAPEAMTYWPVFSQVKLNEDVTSEDVAGLTDATFNIILQADAIQADTFETAAAAFAAFDAQD
jgi:predicted ribosomally synthesized peptide with SipW-like signal peptide